MDRCSRVGVDRNKLSLTLSLMGKNLYEFELWANQLVSSNKIEGYYSKCLQTVSERHDWQR
jgi:hypothetical protein